MAIRVKTKWHNKGAARDMSQTASVIAALIWRLAEQALTRIQKEEYQVQRGQQAFAMLADLLIYLILAADRKAHLQVDEESRASFTQLLAVRVAEILQDNVREITRDMEAPYKAQFIERLNRQAESYAAYDYTDQGPAFGFARALAINLAEVASEQDKTWIYDQIIEIEIPGLTGSLHKGVDGLLSH